MLTLWVTHYFADFIFQNRWMADNKSKNLLALTVHVWVYSFTVLLVTSYMGVDKLVDKWLATMLLHWITDFLTSKCTRYFWYTLGNRYLFFGMIGLDQLIHFICLKLTYGI